MYLENLLKLRTMTPAVGAGSFIAGGAVRCLYDGTALEDFDFFFTDTKVIPKTKEALLNMGYEVKFQCPKGDLTTLKHITEDTKVQLITKFTYPSINKCLETFDFTAACHAWDGKQLISLNDEALVHTKSKVLVLNNLRFPVATMKRLHKYLNKGYTPSPDFYNVLVTEVNQMVLDDEAMLYSLD